MSVTSPHKSAPSYYPRRIVGMSSTGGLDKPEAEQTPEAAKSFTRTWLKFLRTPLIFIDWRKHQKQLKGGLLEMPEFTQYWRIHR